MLKIISQTKKYFAHFSFTLSFEGIKKINLFLKVYCIEKKKPTFIHVIFKVIVVVKKNMCRQKIKLNFWI